MFTEPYNSPGRWGVNFQEKDELLHPNWATVADGLVLNNTNQLRSVGGTTEVSTVDAATAMRRMFVYKDVDGDEIILASQDTRITAGTAVDLTSAGVDVTSATTPTNGYWQFVNFNGKVLGWQEGEAPIVKTTGDFADIVVSAGTLPDGDAVCAAYGRVWAVDDDRQTVRYSALLDETDYSTASGGGAIDMRNVWTLGIDFVTAIAAFNGALIIFGREHIVIYVDSQGSDVGVDPDNLAVSDVIAGTGCVARDTVQMIGDGDIMFLSRHGVQSLSRLLVQKDNPLATVSWQIRDTLSKLVVTQLGAQGSAKADVRAFSSMYIPEQGQYILNYNGSDLQQFIFHLNAKAQDEKGREVVPITVCNDNLAFAPYAGAVGGDGVVYVTRTGLNILTYDLDVATDDTTAIDANYESGWIAHQDPELAQRTKVLKAVEVITKNPAARSAATTLKFTNDYDATLDSITGQAKSATLLAEVFDSMGETEGRVFKFGLSSTDFGRRVIQNIAPAFGIGKADLLHENTDNYTSSDDVEDAGVSTIPFFSDFGGSPLTQHMLDSLPVFSLTTPGATTDIVASGVPDMTDVDGILVAVVHTGTIGSTTMAVKVGSSASLGSLIRCSGDASGFTYGWVGYIPLGAASAADVASGTITLVGGGNWTSTATMDVKFIPVKNGGSGVQSNSDEWGAVAAQLLSSDAVLDDPSITTSRADSQVVCAVTTGLGLTATDDTLIETNDDPTNFTLRDHLGGFANSAGTAQMFLYLAPDVPTNSTAVAPNVTFTLRNGAFGATRASIDAFEVPA
jgi:hypothetical protein